jgi:dihydrodipicolinate reductase
MKHKNAPFVNATTDGVVLDPSEFSITLACLPSITATQELVVPRSIPITTPLTPSLLQKKKKKTENTQILYTHNFSVGTFQ